MMKDEGPYLLEWVAHHLAVGFTDLLVYTNDCSDGTDEMLIRLETLGLAHHRRNVIPPGIRPQPSALTHAQQEPLVAASDWVMVLDADEFLCIHHGDGRLDGLLDAAVAQGANGIVVTWRIFGSGGVQHWSRAPVTEQYLMAAPPNWNKGWGVKTLFRFDPVYWKLGIHRPSLKRKWLETDYPDGVRWLNGSGRPMEDYFKFRGWRSITRTIGYDWAQMNHYAVKSLDAYAMRKFRGNVNLKADKYNADYWALQDRNEERDDRMLRYSAERGRIFAALLTDPMLHRLHHRALAEAEARLATFKQTEAYAALVASLQAAGARPIGAVTARPPQARDPAKIAALMSKLEQRVTETARAARLAAPPASPYVAHPVEVAETPGLLWHDNRGILLPADPRLFSATGLAQIAAGKFERGLLRRLARRLEGSACHVEIGTGCGFLAAHLARLRPGLRQVLQEADPGWRAATRRIWARNGLPPPPLRAEPLTDAAVLAAFLAETRPDSLALADPALTPGLLIAALQTRGTTRPRTLWLSGRLAALWPEGEQGFGKFGI